jgi:hypothetical protein
MHGDLDELSALPDAQKEPLAQAVLAALGIDVKRQQGDELVFACPVSDYHNDQERNPTAALNSSNLLFHCLGCGAGGTILWLIATLHDSLDTIEAARQWLMDEAGLTRAMALPDLLALFDSLYTPTAPAPLPYYSPRMLDRWKELGVPPYILDERHIDHDYALAMGVCLDPDGYIAKVPTGPRAVIPHHWNDQLVGWQSRRLPEADPDSPKYHSTPGFPKDETLYLPDVSRRSRRIVVAEAPMSGLRHGYNQPMAATFGADITDTQVRLITQLPYEEIVFCLDNDPSGWKAILGRTDNHGRRHPGVAERVAAYKNVYVWENPYRADPADMDYNTFAGLVDTAIPWSIWMHPDDDALLPLPA